MKAICSLLMLALSLLACKDFLKEVPTDQITATTFYNTDKDIVETVNSIYGQLEFNWTQRVPLINEFRADQIKVGPQASNATRLIPFDLFTYDNLNADILDTWTTFYKAIDNANVVVVNVPQAAAATDAIKKRVLAEARFLRAFSYYNLVRMWGSVPLKLAPTLSPAGLQIPKNTEEEIYAAIITDLQYAAGETPENPGLPLTYSGVDNGRVTLGAANSLLAEVYLTRKNWAQAASYAKKVIDSKRYELWDNYADAFLYLNKYLPNKAPNGEAVFEIQFNQDAGVGTIITRWTAPRNAVYFGVDPSRGGFGNYAAIPAVYQQYTPQDSRRAAIFPETYQNQADKATKLNTDPNNYYTMKYNLAGQPTARFGNTANNWPVFRLSDLLLIFAEAANELGTPTPDAYAAINRIRTRAKIAALPTGLSQAAFRDSVYTERARELFLEGDRFFDLVRTGRLVSALAKVGVAITEEKKFLPIPQSEIDLNPSLK